MPFSSPFLLGQSSVSSLSRCRLELCFLRQVALYPLFSPYHYLFVHSFSFVFEAVSRGRNCFWAKNSPCQSKTPKGALSPPNIPPLCIHAFKYTQTPTLILVLHFNVDASGDYVCQVVSFLSFCVYFIRGLEEKKG